VGGWADRDLLERRRGPKAVAGFDGETPFAARQTALDGRGALRSARLVGAPMTATFAAGAGENAVLDDLMQPRSGSAAIAWHTVRTFGAPLDGYLAQASPGGPFGCEPRVPVAGGVTAVRLAYTPMASSPHGADTRRTGRER
jgi:hypothetical protein